MFTTGDTKRRETRRCKGTRDDSHQEKKKCDAREQKMEKNKKKRNHTPGSNWEQTGKDTAWMLTEMVKWKQGIRVYLNSAGQRQHAAATLQNQR